MGVPPVIIHFSRLSLFYQPFWGTPNLGKPHTHRIHGAGIYANIKGVY